MKFSWKFVIASLLVALAAGSAFGQNYPWPGSASSAPVICTNCEGNNALGEPNAGKPTYPFRSPIVKHVGRYVDSSTTLSMQHYGFRTARAGRVRIAPTPRGSAPARAYLAIGESVGAYTLANLFTTILPSTMESVGTVQTGAKVGGAGRDPLEKIQMFESFIYPEATTSGWEWQLMDIQHTLGDFDFDDRGLVYAAFPPYGWGICNDDGRTSASTMPKVSQVPYNASIPNPGFIFSLHVGSNYYSIVSDQGGLRQMRWDVTNAASPTLVADKAGAGFRGWAKYEASQRVALISGSDGSLKIYSYQGLVGGNAELVNFPPAPSKKFVDVAFDDSGTLWAIESDNKATTQLLYKFTPAGTSYRKESFDVYARRFNPKFLAVGGGYVAVAGQGTIFNGDIGYDVALFRIQGGNPVLADTDNFFTKFYHTAPSGYAQPPAAGGYTNFQNGIALWKQDAKVYLFYSPFGIGDTFELEGSDSISVQTKSTSFGTANPNSKATQTGPFVGDIVTFNAKPSNAAITYTVDWNFGNPDSADNDKTTNSGVDVTHQYTGLTTAAAITSPKTINATVRTDASITAATSLVLKVPTPRIGFPTGASAWTGISAATSGLKVVAGRTFTDASDGSVESHFGTWSIDTQPDTKLKPNATIGVGAVGPHTVKLTNSYGRYDATTFTIASPYITATPSFSYTVVPFTVKLSPPVKSGTNIVFSGTSDVTSDTTLLPATQWTVTWTLSGTGASAQGTQSSTVGVGQIPSFTVPATGVAPNSTITLNVAVDPSQVGSGAQNYASAQDSQVLSTPDPKIVVSGCGHVGEACTMTAGSISSASTADWTVLWTVKSGGTTIFTSTQNPYTPSFTDQGLYTVSLKATKSVFDATATDASVNVGAALCGPLPAVDILSISSSCNSGCDVNEDVTFLASALGYSFQDCDTITWNFGDGGTATGKRAVHKFTSKKTYTVKMTIKNATNPTGLTVSNNYTVGATSEPPPPPVDTCNAPANIAITWSGSLGCAPGIQCKAGETIVFTALRGTGGLQTCDSVAWDFGDGHTSTSKSLARNTFSAAGSYNVSLVVTNSFGNAPASQTMVIAPAPTTGGCSSTPTEATIYVRYEGATSGCRETNSIVCQKGENINFKIGTFGYSVQSCDTITWTFGDGSATSSSATPVHAYTASGSSFPVSLKISNSNGNATVSRNVPFENVTNTKPAPVLAYESFPAAGIKGRDVTFKVNSNISATGWTWSFGDGSADDVSQSGSTATSRTITHKFNSTGQFTVRVTARNAEGAATDTPGSVLNRITVADAPAEPEYKYLLPVVAHAGGQNGSSWRTDVQIYSQDPTITPSKPLTMTAVLRDMTRTLQISSSTFIYEDFMRVFHNNDDQGPVVITVKGQYAPQIWTRTYNQTLAGTFGQFIPAIRIDDAGSGSSFGDGKYYLAGLRHDDRYRTNIGLVNPNANDVNVQIAVYNDVGASLGSFTRKLTSFQLDQFSIGSALPNLAKDHPFSLEVTVPDGQWLIAYASFIDSGSNDPVYIPAVRSSELKSPDYAAIMLPGVGHIGEWRSDVSIFNPNGRPINVDLSFHDGDGTKKGEALSVPIGAGEFLEYQDLIKQGVFGSVSDTVGVLRVNVSAGFLQELYPLAFARTYNDKGAGKTFGQGIGAFAVPRANVKVGKPALIPAVRDNSKFYTNIGLTNTTGTPVTVSVKLLDPSTGAEIKSVPYSLNAFQSIVGRYTLDGRDNASLKIEATGNIWAFASIVDVTTADPEYVPATPLQ